VETTSLDRAAVPRATSTINIIRTIGGSLGSAVFTVVLQRQIVGQVTGAMGELGALSGGARVAEPLATAFAHTFCWAVGLTALALIPAWFLPRHPPGI
jgi:uncharacterized membrane protein